MDQRDTGTSGPPWNGREQSSGSCSGASKQQQRDFREKINKYISDPSSTKQSSGHVWTSPERTFIGTRQSEEGRLGRDSSERRQAQIRTLSALHPTDGTCHVEQTNKQTNKLKRVSPNGQIRRRVGWLSGYRAGRACRPPTLNSTDTMLVTVAGLYWWALSGCITVSMATTGHRGCRRWTRQSRSDFHTHKKNKKMLVIVDMETLNIS